MFMLKKSLRNFSFTYPCPRKLREVVQLSLFEKENKDKIISLWNEYHATKPHNTANALSKKDFAHLKHNLEACPMFLWPVQR